jgi:sucrose phosphorylase
MEGLEKVSHLADKIYGKKNGQLALDLIEALIEKYKVQKSKKDSYFSQEDVVLITYGDSLKKEGAAPLATLHEFANKYLKGAVSNIHFLPFFPYSSDDGFSVMDFFEIDPELGTWKEVASIGRDFELMFDYVVNHYSSKGQWFQNYLEGKAGFEAFAIDVDPKSILISKTWMCSKK